MQPIKHTLLKLFLAIIIFTSLAEMAIAQSGVYAGGPVYHSRQYSINELKNSGFTYVVVWTIHIDANGSFDFDAEFPLVQNGTYIGGSSYPNFTSDIASLKTGTTSIRRVEFGLSGWGSSTFDNVRNLINAQGTGTSSILYRNFQALKNAFPTVDAISFDDEKTYDANTATQLAVMLGNIGFKVTLCPYTVPNFWTTVATNTNNQRPGTIDRVDLQCYAGGASNTPCNWNFGGIPIYPGLWSQEKTTSQVQTQLTTWKNQCAAKGGFMWLYDDFDNSNLVREYASAINNAFAVVNSTGPVTAYKDCNYSGYSVGLTSGDYTLAQLQSRGILNDDISSIRVNTGYQIQLFEHDNFTGASITITAASSCLVGNGWNDRTSSVRVRTNGVTNLSGVYHIKNRNSSLNMDVSGNSTADGAGIQQWTPNDCGCQKFQFNHLGDGVYQIVATHSGKSLDISGPSVNDGARLIQWPYLNGSNQKFIVHSIGGGFYKLVALHSGKIIEVSNASTVAGGIVQQWTDNNQLCGQWSITPAATVGSFSQTIQAENYSTMAGVQTETTTDAGGGLNVGWIDLNDWMAYNSINIPATGSYLVEYRVASPNSTGRVSLDLNAGAIQLGSLAIPNTGGWQNWTTISHLVNINAGTYNFGVAAPAGGWNLNWWRISSASGARIADSESLEAKSADYVLFPSITETSISLNPTIKIAIGTKFRIINSQGIEVVRGSWNNSSLDVSDLNPGIYTIVISDNQKPLSGKFIKK